jgi:hypothetical protein
LKRGQREREKWSARVAILASLQGEGRKIREGGEKNHLAEIHLNFKKFKIWSK